MIDVRKKRRGGLVLLVICDESSRGVTSTIFFFRVW